MKLHHAALHVLTDIITHSDPPGLKNDDDIVVIQTHRRGHLTLYQRWRVIHPRIRFCKVAQLLNDIQTYHILRQGGFYPKKVS
ncbi:TPA: hypothetical protein ACP2Q9_003240 [Escherichia coli]|nr:hypothetical protein [Escherichia coli]HAW0132166.1 hypothetical protein [Escherichia coli]